MRRKLTPPPAAVQLSDPLTTQGSHWVTGWSGSGSVTFNVNPTDGSSHTTTLRVSGNGVDWTTNARRVGTISQGQVARLAFKLSQTGTGAVMAVETTDSAYYFGVYEEAGALRLRVKQNAVYTNVGTLLATVSANVWYGLELVVDGAAGFRASVWREDTPGVRDELRYEMPGGTNWRFRVWAKSGQTYIDGTTGPSYAYVEEVSALSASDSRIVGKHYEYDSVSAQTTKRYYVGGRLIATRTGSSVRYVHADHLGSTTTLTDPAGNVVAKEKYSASGERRRGESPLVTDQLYTGQRYNALSSLYHYSDGMSAGRFYDPLLGRFMSADSVTPGSSSQTLNRFSYGLNNPVRYIDPNGQACIDANAGGGIGVGAAYAVGMSIGNEISRQAAQWGQRVTQWGPQVTATVDKAAGIAKSAQQNAENAQRASQSGEPDAGGADPNDPRRGGMEGLTNALKPGVELAQATAARTAEASKDAYAIAKAGGKHSGLLDSYSRRSPREVAKAIRSYERTIEEHLQKIADPTKATLRKPWTEMSREEQWRAINDWTRDVLRNQEELNVLRGLYNSMPGDK